MTGFLFIWLPKVGEFGRNYPKNRSHIHIGNLCVTEMFIMSLSSASFGTKIPNPVFYTRTNNLQTKHVVGTTKTFFFFTNSLRSSSPQFVSLSNDNQTLQMEGGQFPLETTDNYSKELEVAVRAVHMACLLCQIVQESLVSNGNDQVQSKPDNSPVTIAGNSAIICC